MQTFLPHGNFIESAKCLDRQRLGKQRVEGYQILQTILGISDGWKNHPAVKMWMGHELALSLYIYTICTEWTNREYKDTIKEKTENLIKEYEDRISLNPQFYPSWFGDPKLHDSHKSNLLRKNPEYYGKFNWKVEDNLPYVWPV